MNVLSLFAGIGGICKAFQDAGFKNFVANEIDEKACETYKENFNHTLIQGDITDNRVMHQILRYECDVLAAGFPCQSFSRAGKKKGMTEPRGRLIDTIFYIISIKQPKAIFLENVPALISINDGADWEYIRTGLIKLGYYVSYKIIDAQRVGYSIQARNRLYITATLKDSSEYDFFSLPTKNFSNDAVDWNYSHPTLEYTEERMRRIYIDKVSADNMQSFKFYAKRFRRVGIIENKRGCPTLKASMGTGGNNVPIIKTTCGKVRKLSPRECFNLMTFPSNFKFPDKMANLHLYKQAGNSVIVILIKEIAKNILKFLA